jgi:hypothetical protein
MCEVGCYLWRCEITARLLKYQPNLHNSLLVEVPAQLVVSLSCFFSEAKGASLIGNGRLTIFDDQVIKRVRGIYMSLPQTSVLSAAVSHKHEPHDYKLYSHRW